MNGRGLRLGPSQQERIAALLIGTGVGAIVRVVQQILPTLRDETGQLLYPASVAGIIGGMLLLYATGLLVAA